MAMRAWWIVLLVALAGCTDGDDGSDTDAPGSENAPADQGSTGSATNASTPTPNDPEPEPTPEPTPPRDPVTWTITVQGNDFVEGSITIQAGDTVKWVHDDGTTPHTATSDDGTTFHSGDCPGTTCMTPLHEEYSFTFNEVAEVPYHCEVHPSMTDTITILERFDGTPA